jgi:nitrate reductase gamma subunit
MLPRHKETIRLHPMEFAVGLLLHAGAGLALLGVGFSLIGIGFGLSWFRALRPVLGLALVCGLGLLVRRAVSRNLRAISTLDDYLAILSICGFLALAGIVTRPSVERLLLYAGALLVYLPLGKLRHVLFCPVARGDVGLRLGHRGVYPPPSGRESMDALRR